jgi:hypothetical protein
MDTYRTAAAPQGWSPNGIAILSTVVSGCGHAGAEIRQLIGDIARLAAEDPALAARVTQEVLSSTPASTQAELADALAGSLDERTLGTLCRAPGGQALLDVLERSGASGAIATDRPGFAGRAGAAGVATDWDWAGKAFHPGIGQALAAAASPRARAAGGEDAAKEQVTSLFREQFAGKAADKEDFHAFLRQVYGAGYDRDQAEQLRQRALAGDFTWLPDLKFVDAAALGGANGAYNAQEGVVYINRELAAADPHKAAQTFVEEAGHHLDTRLNTVDTQGDEGEMFRRVLGGEQLSAQQVAAIRAENDKGVITVDGRKVEVEFWFGEDLVDAAGDVASSVVDKAGAVVEDVVEYAGNAARDVAYSLGDAVKDAGMGVIDTVGLFMQGFVVDVVGGTFMNLIKGRPADAWDSITRGLDKMVIQAPRRFINGALSGAGHVLKTGTYLLPAGAGDKLRGVVDRGIDSVRSLANGVIDIVRNVYRLPFEIGVGFMKDIGEALKHWARGDIGEGFERFGLAFVNPFKRIGGAVVDSAMVAGQAVGNVFGNVFGLHEPSRGLSSDERDYLKSIYGDSLNLEDIRIHRGNLSHDLGMKPHCVGNDIYLPDDCFNTDGSLNQKGRITLVHEAFHVYQAQHGGNDYIHEALLAQSKGIVEDGDFRAAYNWLEPFRAGKPFSEWNPEQQAKFIETMAIVKSMRVDTDGNGTLDSDYDLNDNGRIEQMELELALVDTNRNGRRDAAPAGSAPGTADPEPALNLNYEEYARAMAIWNAIKDNRPDRTVV